MTPPFGGVGHWEGDGKHWEKIGSGYSQVAGDVWYELEDTKDEGYYNSNTAKRIEYPSELLLDYTDYSLSLWSNTWLKIGNDIDPESVGEYESYINDNFGETWIIYRTEIIQAYQEGDFTSPGTMGKLQVFAYRIDNATGDYVSVLYDYWNTWIYRNLEWTKTNTALIKRSHV